MCIEKPRLQIIKKSIYQSIMVAMKYKLLKIIAFMCMLMVNNVIGDGDSPYICGMATLWTGSRCRMWISDKDDNAVADTGYTDCQNCRKIQLFMVDDPDAEYYITAKVQGSLTQQKRRGPFRYTNGSIVFRLDGSVFGFGFDQVKTDYGYTQCGTQLSKC
ncbi:hypothetical protein Glove_94g43 [Diversispora epigaea]|uniref:Uncharacterized protein n=1 Tax=Diversispora epigaea TaxID=1348612 RepID=A0A397JBQ7_9GLOM|nr:hypothetical protein Glove_94g43 [Diversispora epigaea]